MWLWFDSFNVWLSLIYKLKTTFADNPSNCNVSGLKFVEKQQKIRLSWCHNQSLYQKSAEQRRRAIPIHAGHSIKQCGEYLVLSHFDWYLFPVIFPKIVWNEENAQHQPQSFKRSFFQRVRRQNCDNCQKFKHWLYKVYMIKSIHNYK